MPLHKTLPRFDLQQLVKIPETVSEKKEARVCGIEWGPDNEKLKVDMEGWVYYIRFQPNDPAFIVSEKELLSWQGA